MLWAIWITVVLVAIWNELCRRDVAQRIAGGHMALEALIRASHRESLGSADALPDFTDDGSEWFSLRRLNPSKHWSLGQAAQAALNTIEEHECHGVTAQFATERRARAFLSAVETEIDARATLAGDYEAYVHWAVGERKPEDKWTICIQRGTP